MERLGPRQLWLPAHCDNDQLVVRCKLILLFVKQSVSWILVYFFLLLFINELKNLFNYAKLFFPDICYTRGLLLCWDSCSCFRDCVIRQTEIHNSLGNLILLIQLPVSFSTFYCFFLTALIYHFLSLEDLLPKLLKFNFWHL